jgi:hypothetical protein
MVHDTKLMKGSLLTMSKWFHNESRLVQQQVRALVHHLSEQPYFKNMENYQKTRNKIINCILTLLKSEIAN